MLQRFHFLWHCSFVASVNLQSCLRFLIFIAFCCWRRVRVFYLFCLAFLSLSRRFYRFSLVFIVLVSFYLDLCYLIFSLFCSILESFFERCGGKLSVNRFYSTKMTYRRLCRITTGFTFHPHLDMQIRQNRMCSRSAK